MLAPFLTKLRTGADLSVDDAAAAMEAIVTGRVTETELADYLVALAEKGETADEIAGSARVLRDHAERIRPKVENLVDVCGTGGDASGTFNISTTVAFVTAGAGVAVAKHGNRAVSSSCGSADVLAALGVVIDLPPEKVCREIEEVGIGFLFAPNFHSAMKHAAPVRAKLKRRTIFNLLGPLVNPAFPRRQVIGVFAEELVPIFAAALQKMDFERAIVVHGDGLDEFTTAGQNTALILKDGQISDFPVELSALDIPTAQIKDLAGGDADTNATIIRAVLDGQTGATREIVVLNSAAALVVAGRATDLTEGVLLARESIDSGAARQKLADLINFSQRA